MLDEELKVEKLKLDILQYIFSSISRFIMATFDRL